MTAYHYSLTCCSLCQLHLSLVFLFIFTRLNTNCILVMSWNKANRYICSVPVHKIWVLYQLKTIAGLGVYNHKLQHISCHFNISHKISCLDLHHSHWIPEATSHSLEYLSYIIKDKQTEPFPSYSEQGFSYQCQGRHARCRKISHKAKWIPSYDAEPQDAHVWCGPWQFTFFLTLIFLPRPGL